jgi:ORF6N domain
MPKIILKPESLAPLVHAIRGEKVLLDADLAVLYGVTTKAFNQAVKRNRARFPADFMFRLTAGEWEALRSQTVTASSGGKAMRSQIVTASRRNIGALPYAFTEQGIAMLSSVLRSPRAVEVNIAIMRTFVQLRRLMDSNRSLARKIEAMEEKYDEQFAVVFDAIKRLIADDTARNARPKRRIGFLP